MLERAPTWNASANLSPGPYFLYFFLIYILVSGRDRGSERGVQRAAFPRLCSLAPENNFFGVQNLSGCSLKTAPHLRRVTLKCHFWSPNQSAFSFLIGRKLTVKLQGISATAVNFQKYFAAAKTIECGLNEQYALFIPHHQKEHAFDFSMNNPLFDFFIFFSLTWNRLSSL